MQEFEFNTRIMGTELSASIVTESMALAESLFNASFERLKAYEAQFSRFIPTSELSRLNTERTLVVSPLFLKVLDIAKKLYTKTQGYFNPLLQIDRFGYTQTYETIKDVPHIKQSAPYNVDFDAIIIDGETRTVTLTEDQKLDFGGFLKGFFAEREAKKIMEENERVQGVIVNIGGDIHTRGRDESEAKFIFEVTNPHGKANISLSLENESLATSGTYKRTWVSGDKSMHHILARDGTMNPQTDIISVSVIHESGANAEAYAKALFSLTPLELEKLTGEKITYALILKDGEKITSL